MNKSAYDSDVPDDAWSIIEPLLKNESKAGRKQTYPLRQIWNGIMHVLHTGTQWRSLPHDFSHWRSVYWRFMKYRNIDKITISQINPRKQLRLRLGRIEDPGARSIDSQTVKTTCAGEAVGYDGGKKIKGGKRHLLVDTLCLVFILVVHSASVVDRRGTEKVMQTGEVPKRMKLVWADQGYTGPIVDTAARKANF